MSSLRIDRFMLTCALVAGTSALPTGCSSTPESKEVVQSMGAFNLEIAKVKDSSVRSLPAFGRTSSLGRRTTPGRTCPAVSVGRKPKAAVTTTPTSRPVRAGCGARTNGRLVASRRSATPRAGRAEAGRWPPP